MSHRGGGVRKGPKSVTYYLNGPLLHKASRSQGTNIDGPVEFVITELDCSAMTLIIKETFLDPETSQCFSPSNAESKQDSPPLTKALKTIDSKPMMRISDDYFAKKTGFAQNADSSSKTVVEKAIPTLNSKTLEPSKKLTYSRYVSFFL